MVSFMLIDSTRSREAAVELSAGRKPWVACRKIPQVPLGTADTGDTAVASGRCGQPTTSSRATHDGRRISQRPAYNFGSTIPFCA